MSWLEERGITDVQSALQSQAIQSVLEKNAQGLSDGAFNSFLTNAPIPRAYCESTTNTTLTNNAEVIINFTDAGRVFDPYQIYVGSNTFRLPMDGFYTIQTSVEYQQPAGAGSFQQYAGLRSTIGTYGTGLIVVNESVGSLLAGTGPFQEMPVFCVKPFKAGDSFNVVGFQASSANETHTAGVTRGIGIVWNAPYRQYNQSGGVQ